ncbi:MAG: beta-N-acetylglucosaminidase domain-containing protein [Clostridia bacterium]|nr:beta-N-acetylglucosaminidase domain-containing protein [Clostridia bacterium]
MSINDVLFSSFLADPGIEVCIDYENTRRVTYSYRTRRATDEKYLLSVEKDGDMTKVKVVCSGEKSAFYALCEIAEKRRHGTLYPGDYDGDPAFRLRGYIEGFYGVPWKKEERLTVISAMAKKRMNAYFYAPKDDLYHRRRWRELYPEADLAGIRLLSDTAKSYYMDFFWCVAPGLSIRYGSQADFDLLMLKTRQLYDIGVKCFGLLLDDIDEYLQEEDRERYGETVNAHIDLVNRYHAALTALDPEIKLAVCPTLYHGKGDEYYITQLGTGIPPAVMLFWTGRDICSRELTADEAARFFVHTRHMPLYWDNYPVNDMAMRREMHLGPIAGRDPDLGSVCEGLIANVMEYPLCSLIPLSTVADFLWAPSEYDEHDAYQTAIADAVGAENYEAFRIFADFCFTSCLQMENASILKGWLSAVSSFVYAGDLQKAARSRDQYLTWLNAADAFLQKDLPICRELEGWAKKFHLAVEIIPLLFDEIIAPDEARREKLREMIDEYERDPHVLADAADFLEVLWGNYRKE